MFIKLFYPPQRGISILFRNVSVQHPIKYYVAVCVQISVCRVHQCS